MIEDGDKFEYSIKIIVKSLLQNCIIIYLALVF